MLEVNAGPSMTSLLGIEVYRFPLIGMAVQMHGREPDQMRGGHRQTELLRTTLHRNLHPDAEQCKYHNSLAEDLRGSGG